MTENNEYLVEYSFIQKGERVYARDCGTSESAKIAAKTVLDEHANLEGIEIYRVWINGGCWKTVNFE